MPVTSDDMKLVEHQARRLGGHGGANADRDDLISDGSLGLVRAVEMWDGDRAVRDRFQERQFFLRKLVTRAIIDGFRRRNGRSKGGSDYRKQAFRLTMLRLDELVDDGRGGDESYLDRFVGSDDESFVVVKELLAQLPERERLVVWRTIVEGDPMRVVADDLEVSESRICQIRLQALARLRGEPVSLPREEQRNAAGLFSDRELEVLAELADGFDNRAIADRLLISEETVKSHIRHLLSKLEAKSRTHAVSIAFRAGLVT